MKAVLFILCALSSSAWAQKESTPPPPQPFTINGGVYLWYYEPFLSPATKTTELNVAWLTVEGAFGDFGIYLEPRLRTSRLRPYYTSNFWLQEAYVRWQSAVGTVKAGKLYTRFGRF